MIKCERCYSELVDNTWSDEYGFHYHCRDCDYKFSDDRNHIT